MSAGFVFISALIISSVGIPEGFASGGTSGLSDRLTSLRKKGLQIEGQLISTSKGRVQARENLKRIQKLIELQREERQLSQQRLDELERTILELENRRKDLDQKITTRKNSLRTFLTDLEGSLRETIPQETLMEREVIEAPRRKVLSKLVDRGVKEIEMLRIDLADADVLESRIQEEKQYLTYLFQDLKEQESVLELNKRIQVDLLREKHQERVAQLENYRKLKTAEAQVEDLIQDFNARIELEKSMERERLATKAMMQGAFAQLQGKLPLPVDGKIISNFGRSFDSNSKLHVFKKGIDILPEASGKGEALIKAIAPGKIAYSGELPKYGKVTIVDHGEQFYSLCAQLGELRKKVGDVVSTGDVIGSTDGKGTPVYFEIRARNVPVNPLQWVSI